MRLSFDDLPARVALNIRERLLAMLAASPRFRSPRTWPHAAIVWTPERREVTHRLQLAAEFREAGLFAEGHEAGRLRVGRGEVLVWLVRDDQGGADAGLGIVRLIGGTR